MTPSPSERPTWWQQVTVRQRWFIGLSALPLVGTVLLAGFYYRYAALTDKQLRTGVFQNATDVYAAPAIFTEGDELTPQELGVALQLAGLSPSAAGAPRTFRLADGVAAVFLTGKRSEGDVRLKLADGKKISAIEVNGIPTKQWSAGNPLVATITPRSEDGDGGTNDREKRHMVSFNEIPKVLVDAVTSAEDKHFFEHHGIDTARLLKAVWVDFREGRKRQGGSTLTMQLVRGLWLEPEKRFTRKAAELMMTFRLERKWSKEKIFEAYANQIYLGRQSAYGIHGFAEGARMFFRKPLRDLTLPEAALLAGLIQRPSFYNPYRHPERAKERRNLVLALMRDNGRIASAQYQNAISAPLTLAGELDRDDSFGAPYFLDLVTEELQKTQTDDPDRPDSMAQKVYTTVDLNLQKAASEAIESGMKEADALLARRESKGAPTAHAEAALIAIDPHTGEIKALVGGRNYAHSQLNRILARRPPGSIFKPFVYAAAFKTGVDGGDKIFTPATVIDDSPETFWFGGKPYEPANFHQQFFGELTLREALAKSDNIAAVKLANQVGYGSVVALARRAGLNDEIQATPSVALGSYVVTPLEMAGAWTMFANEGTVVKPHMLREVKSADGVTLRHNGGESRQALDPRVAYLTVAMLQEVMRSGTAAGVRSRGFVLPAAGKTGTSHDGWFAGFTSELLCLVWVGFDDYRQLNLEGAKSALPIWTNFMKAAAKRAPYRNGVEFKRPNGITSAGICMDTGKLATEFCPDVRSEVFISGTQPSAHCDLHDFAAGELIGQTQ